MRKFLCTHTFPTGAFTHEQLCQVAEAAQHDLDVRGYRSFFNLTEGKGSCVLEADDQETLVNWFHKMEIPYDGIWPVEYEGERGTICNLTEHPEMAGAV
jgi:hypothetical protein